MSRVWSPRTDLRRLAASIGDVSHYAALLDDHRRLFNLNVLGRDYLGEGKVEGLDMTMPGGAGIYPAWQVTPYGRQDVSLALRLWEKMRPELIAQRLERVAALEDALNPVTVEMEMNGCPLDVEKLARWEVESAGRFDEVQGLLERMIGRPINVNSDEEVAQLCEERGHRSTERTKPSKTYPQGQPSYSDLVLEGFAKTDPVVAHLRKVIHVAHLRSKFIVPYAHSVCRDGVMRYQLNQLRSDEYGTVSGRYSSSALIRDEERAGTNVQQVYSVENNLKSHCTVCVGLPKISYRRHVDEGHPEAFVVRELYVPPRGRRLAGGDSEQIEFRLFAHYAKARKIIEAYERDPHADFHQVVTDMAHQYNDALSRKQVKNANFMLIFGGGKKKTADMLGMSLQHAAEFRQVYNQAFPEAKILFDAAVRVAETRGYVFTAMGRRCRFPGRERTHKALNAIIQGSAADYHKLKLVALYHERERLGFTMRMTVHDEIVGDVADDSAVKAVNEFLDLPAPEIPLDVPLLWSLGTGSSWAECK